MNLFEFLSTFEKHLRVAEPKRSEIIAEIKSHHNEDRQIGDPKRIAETMNRTWIGFFSSPTRIIVGIVIVFVISAAANEYHSYLRDHLFYSTEELRFFESALFTSFVLIPSILAVVVGRASARTLLPTKTLGVSIVITFISLLVIFIRAGHLTPGEWMTAAVLPAIVATILFSGIAMLTLIVYLHKHPSKTSHFDALIAAACTSIALVLVLFVMQTIDNALSLRLPTIIVYAPAVVVSLLILAYFVRRSKTIRQ